MASLIELYSPQAWARLPAPTAFKGWLTGVGSRDTPADVRLIMRLFAAVTYSMGYRWRSGGADGSDEAFESGVLDHPHYQRGTCLDDLTLEIYLPWNGFQPIPGGPIKKYQDFARGYIDSSKLPSWEDAQELATFIHPLGDALRARPGIFSLHSRNMFQPLGRDLLTPSKYLYLFAKPTKDGKHVEGGTRSAHYLATYHRIPTINFYHEEPRIRTVEFLKDYALKHLTV